MSVLETKLTSQPHANIFFLVSKAIPWVSVDWDPISLPKGSWFLPSNRDELAWRAADTLQIALLAPHLWQLFHFTLCCAQQWPDSAGSQGGHLPRWICLFSIHFHAFGGNEED